MADTVRYYRAGYLDPITGDWIVGIAEIQTDVGYCDIDSHSWNTGVPDIQSGEWLPEQAMLMTDQQQGCPEEHPIKGNLPSRIFHSPEQSSYERTDPEICFASESAAMTAGFRKSQAADSATNVR